MLPTFNLALYRSTPDKVSLYNNIPMEYLETAKSILRAKGVTFRIRYRGARKDRYPTKTKRFEWITRKLQGGTKTLLHCNHDVFNGHAHCLKGDATKFSVYPK